MKNFFTSLKRFIASSKFFWQFRHFFQFNAFQKNYGYVPEKHFISFFDFPIKSVLDYGCATSDKLFYFIDRSANFVYGIDINRKAIKTSKKKASEINSTKLNFFFDNKFNQLNLMNFLKANDLKKFDLLIFDRVLYIMNIKDIENILSFMSQYTHYIYIDDFYIPKNKKSPIKNYLGYRHLNYDSILKNHGFDIIKSTKSPYKDVIHSHTRACLYKKKSN